MILGMQAVVDVADMRLGNFYLMEFDGEACVTQCVQAPQLRDGESDLIGLRYAPDTPFPLSLEDLPQDAPVISLHEVRVRVDAPSAFRWSNSSPIRAGMFIVSGDEAFVAVPRGFREWILVNIVTGQIAHNRLRDKWVAFSRWLLVIEENGEEIPIASFGGEE